MQLAKEVGVRKTTISEWESGLSTPQPANFASLTKALGVLERDLRFGIAKQLLIGQNSLPIEAATTAAEESEETWSPNPALKNKIPTRAYETALEYCRRLVRAGLPRESIEEAERLMIDSRYAQANKREGRELPDDDWILLVDDTWDAIRETLSWKGVRV